MDLGWNPFLVLNGFPIPLVLFIVHISVSVSAAPLEDIQIAYICQEGNVTLEAPFKELDTQCEESWTIGKEPIAIYKNDRGKVKTKEYIPPCKDVFFGKVILSKCASVTLTIGCTKDGLYDETRIHFLGTNAIAATANAQIAHYGLWALVMLLVFLIVL